MRIRRRIWLVMAVVCIGATLYEIPNGRLLWRYALSGRNKQAALDRTKTVSALPEDVRTTDPEAAAILDYCLSDPNDEALSDLVARYPENAFFLAQFAERLLEAHNVDRQAALTVANQLIALNPENAHYRYLKGWIRLKPPRDAGDEREALEQFEEGNRRSEFHLPLSRYRERVDRLCDEVGMSLLARSKLHPSQTRMYFDLGAFLSRSP